MGTTGFLYPGYTLSVDDFYKEAAVLAIQDSFIISLLCRVGHEQPPKDCAFNFLGDPGALHGVY